VAAGGGSRLFFRSGLFVVGPESSGAHPGPVCYRKNGYLSITDANLFLGKYFTYLFVYAKVILGRLLPEYFPKIFGPSEKEPLDSEATKKAFLELTKEVNEYYERHGEGEEGKKVVTPDEVAHGFIEVANGVVY